MTLPSANDILAFHDRALAGPGGATSPPQPGDAVWREIEIDHRSNRLLWEQEDQARRRDVPDAEIAANKRAIDAYNQRRNDAIERLDEALLAQLPAPAPGARQHSETAGAIIDRLSILALKIHHMRRHAERADASAAHRERSLARLARLIEQRNDLAACLDALLADCRAGRAFFKVYRQFKMYNDPAYNPYLSGTSRPLE